MKYIVLTSYSYSWDTGRYTPNFLAKESHGYEQTHLRDQAREFTHFREAARSKYCYQISSVLRSDDDLSWFHKAFNS